MDNEGYDVINKPMTTKAEKLNQLIDEISGVCAQGQGGIRKLVQEITGEKLIAEPASQTYKVGDQFHLSNGNNYILGAAEPSQGGTITRGVRVLAINLATGSRRGAPIAVKNCSRITEAELRGIFKLSLRSSLPIRTKQF